MVLRSDHFFFAMEPKLPEEGPHTYAQTKALSPVIARPTISMFIIAVVAVTLPSIRTSRSWTNWKDAIGRPNCSRDLV